MPRDRIREGVGKLSLAAKNVSDWAIRSGLQLNPSKTQAIIFSSRHFVNSIKSMELPGVELDSGVVVPFSDEVTSLGVVLDRALSWKPYIDLTTRKVNRVLYMLRFIRSCTTEALRSRLIQALVLPHLDYCGIVLLDATFEQKTRLQRLQNSCVRYIYGLRRDVHITPYRMLYSRPFLQSHEFKMSIVFV